MKKPTIAALGLATAVRCQTISDTANDMLNIIQGNADCTSLAVIFARGTFDSGNIGVWVGPQFFSEIASRASGSIALQGVDANDYTAELSGYLAEGGSNDGAASMASSVTAYYAQCPDSKIVVSGWSQGALVAHKALQQVSSPALDSIVGLVTFGDPNGVWNNISLPTSIPSSNFDSSCITGTVFDPLCASLPADFVFPSSLSDIIDPFVNSLPDLAVGTQQIEAAAKLIVEFPTQLAESWDAFVAALEPEQFVRLMLTPQHFLYGDNGMVGEAADWVVGIAEL